MTLDSIDASPGLSSPLIAAILREWNKGNHDKHRRRNLRQLELLAIGTNDGRDAERVQLAVEWLTNECAPLWMDFAGLNSCAEVLRNLHGDPGDWDAVAVANVELAVSAAWGICIRHAKSLTSGPSQAGESERLWGVSVNAAKIVFWIGLDAIVAGPDAIGAKMPTHVGKLLMATHHAIKIATYDACTTYGWGDREWVEVVPVMVEAEQSAFRLVERMAALGRAA